MAVAVTSAASQAAAGAAAGGKTSSGLASTVKHMEGLLWYEMLSELNQSGLSTDALGAGSSSFQSMFLWNIAQNDFGKYDSQLTAAAIQQLGGRGADPAAASADAAAAQTIAADPTVTPVASAIADVAGTADIDRTAAVGNAAVGAAAGSATGAGPAPVAGGGGNASSGTGKSGSLIDQATGFARKMWPEFTAAAQKLGVPAVAILAQSALETGWGVAAGGNNLFGIKASDGENGTTRQTHEVVDGVLTPQLASFRDYPTSAASVADYVALIRSGYQHAVGQGSIAGFAQALQAGGYATAGDYAAKIVSIAQSPLMARVLQAVGDPAPAAASY